MSFSKQIAVLYHIFYEDTILHIEEQLKALKSFNPFYFFNISADAPDQAEIRTMLQQHFNDAVIITSSNQGKDIGAKLLLIHTCLRLNIEPGWFIFLHDKKSHQALNASTWKQDLMTIADPRNIDMIKGIINDNTDYGIIAPEKQVKEETIENGNFISTNSTILQRLLDEYKLAPKDFRFVAGTMFWARASAYLNFFKAHDALEIRRTLEKGNVVDDFSGTYTHSWERLLSWIPSCQGYTIKTI